MAYDPGALEATLAAAAGHDPALIADLRRVFFDAADGHVCALRLAEDDDAWRVAAGRLASLAAGFGALRVVDAAHAAARARRDDGGTLARIERALAALYASD